MNQFLKGLERSENWKADRKSIWKYTYFQLIETSKWTDGLKRWYTVGYGKTLEEVTGEFEVEIK